MKARFFRVLKIWGLISYALFVFVIFLGSSASAGAGDLFMYCGAGLRQPVDVLLKQYRQQTGVNVVVEFGGSGQLLARFKATRKGDLFLPGSHFYIDQLKKNGQIFFSLPVVLHTPVVAVNREMAGVVKTFADLAKPGVRVGLGDPKAMALGRTAEDILSNSGLKEAILKNTVTRAATVKQLTLYVVKGDVAAAIIARADAVQNPKHLVFFEIDPDWYRPEIVTVAALKTASDPEMARKLAQYFGSPYAVEVFGKYGFLPAK